VTGVLRHTLAAAAVCAAIAIAAAPAQAAGTCSNGTASGHWSSLTASLAAFCTGAPASYTLGSAAGMMDGDFTLSADGSVTYEFDPALGRIDTANDSFTFQAHYSDGTQASGSITFHPVDVAPICSVAGASTTAGQQLTLSLPCSDSGEAVGQADPIRDAIVSQPAHGSLLGDPSSGSITYVPAAGYAGPDSFRFKANDGVEDSAVATYSLTIAPKPLTLSETSSRLGATLNDLFAALRSRPLTVSGRKVAVGSVPADACPGPCSVRAALDVKSSGRRREIGVASVTFAGGERAPVVIRLSRAGGRLLAKSRKVHALLSVTLTSGQVTRGRSAKVVLRRR